MAAIAASRICYGDEVHACRHAIEKSRLSSLFDLVLTCYEPSFSKELVVFSYPFDKGLALTPLAAALIAKHYAEKYAISLHIFDYGKSRSPNYDDLDGYVSAQMVTEEPFGIILHHSTHAAALLFHYSSLSRRYEILLMDSADTTDDHTAHIKTALHLATKQRAIFYRVIKDGQLDSFSCMTFALVRLRNALWDLKKSPVSSLGVEKLEHVASMSADVLLPFSWSCIDQTHTEEPAEDIPSVRNPKESAVTFRNRYIVPIPRLDEPAKPMMLYPFVKAYKIAALIMRKYEDFDPLCLVAEAAPYFTLSSNKAITLPAR